jgi:DNA-binding MarR family transcriptional regulator
MGDKRAALTAEQVLQVAVAARRLYTPLSPGSRLHGLEPLDLQALIALSLAPGASVGEVAAMLDVIPQTASKSLRRLRDRDLVNDAAPRPDGRERGHRLTSSGKSAVNQFLRRAEKCLEELPADVVPPERS